MTRYEPIHYHDPSVTIWTVDGYRPAELIRTGVGICSDCGVQVYDTNQETHDAWHERLGK